MLAATVSKLLQFNLHAPLVWKNTYTDNKLRFSWEIPNLVNIIQATFAFVSSSLVFGFFGFFFFPFGSSLVVGKQQYGALPPPSGDLSKTKIPQGPRDFKKS